MSIVKVKLKHHRDPKESVEHLLNSSTAPLVLEAVNGADYLVETDDGVNNLQVKRVGDDLYFFEQGEAEPKVIVQSYFNAEDSQVLVNNSRGDYQVFDLSAEAKPEAMLASEVSGGNLKTVGIVAGGLGVLAAVAALGSGGSGGGSDSENSVKPIPPDVTKPVPPSSNKPVENKPVENKPVENKPVENKPVENKPVENKPVENKPVENKPVENKPVENKPVENKPVENKPVENKPVENKPVENKPVENKPVENKPVENKPVENKPVDNKPVDNEPAKPVASGKESGLTLDTADHYYSPKTIKAFIDTISKAGGTFLQLHFSDHTGYGIESKILGQTTDKAVLNADGSYTNPQTGKQFLSYSQVADIAKYAKEKGVELIPEVGTPNHMDAIFQLLEYEKGAAYVKSLKSDLANDEIKITSEKSIDFVKSLLGEVIGAFGDSSKHLHIGGDEFGYPIASNHEFISYANNLAAFLADNGLGMRMWNDGLIKANLGELNRDIQVTYWSYDGNPGNEAVAAERRAFRASLPDLLDEGFEVLNYNSYYLYSVPEDGSGTSQSGDFAARDTMLNWDLGVWDGKNHDNAIEDTSKIIGSSLSIWSEEVGSLSDATIQKYTESHLTAIIEKTKAAADSTGKALAELESASANGFVNLVQEVYMDFEQIKDDEIINLWGNGTQILNLLQEDVLDSKTGLDVWVHGTQSDIVKLDASNWAKSTQMIKKGTDDFVAYEHNGNKLWVDIEVVIQMI